MNILVTGGNGFIGSNFIRYVLKNSDYNVVNLDLLTYAGNRNNLLDVNSHKYEFIYGDINNEDLINLIINKFNINVILNFAAESHVDRSIEGPKLFFETNLMGTQSLLNQAKKNSIDRFIQISTDEVYGSIENGNHFSESSPLKPNSPYSSSKAGADLLVRSYYKTYDFPGIITRCSNNYGPYQHPEKLIPMVIKKALRDEKLPVYGDGKQIRDWLHVDDHCKAIFTVLKYGNEGEVYNIGGNNEIANIEVIKNILRYLNKSYDLIEYVKDRKGHDRRYAIDSSKLKNELGWEPEQTFEKGINHTLNWYLNNASWVEDVEKNRC
ncbi:dTDP-glucose 4,6-dehydratase [Marinococcus halotolerans]|uniref:dTDP-glucose 4,6-dehydratase n=1 Tax=Marinococcus halotolerans TaxID=301092 RepID=UPI0003B5CD91|nr:dTDP-glucose 4,6-dehydratase [Marinococcus halotolerans]